MLRLLLRLCSAAFPRRRPRIIPGTTGTPMQWERCCRIGPGDARSQPLHGASRALPITVRARAVNPCGSTGIRIRKRTTPGPAGRSCDSVRRPARSAPASGHFLDPVVAGFARGRFAARDRSPSLGETGQRDRTTSRRYAVLGFEGNGWALKLKARNEGLHRSG
jgi:hypothetical protein